MISSFSSPRLKPPLFLAVFTALFVIASGLWIAFSSFIATSFSFGPLMRRALASPDDFSIQLIRDSLLRYAQKGDADLGGFMLAFEEKVHIAAVKIIDGGDIGRTVYPYISNFNAQYDAVKLLTFGQPQWGAFAYMAGSFVSCLCMGLVVAAIGLWASRELSLQAGLASMAVFAFSPALIERSLSPYWMIFLAFLPFVACLYLYPTHNKGKRFLLLNVLVGTLVLLKCLTGYEYITTTSLMCAVPIIYHEFKSTSGTAFAAARRATLQSMIVGVSCVAGFACAAILHIAKAALFFGSLSKGVDAFLLPLLYSTAGSESGIRGGIQITASSVGYAYLSTFVVRNGPINAAVLLALLGGLYRYRMRAHLLPLPQQRHLHALCAATLASVAATVSWEVIVLKHTIVHSHLNWITMYLGALPFAAMLAAELWRLAISDTPAVKAVGGTEAAG
ncbi:hypothetical protein [Rhizobium sp. CSW-27]|uniref:hypothetical protein n=1 Tax=Rhizobium sp. CSW-27 TaxID=2839985 RepID=UPI001C02EC9F|nr:hypothetical protein [Rhizobium sp. CSW-27]MBT9371474.1 hypothetical protein [Rhizobium sp. CSW-27]